MSYEAHAQDTTSPGDDEEAQPPSSPKTADDEIRWQFEESVADEEDQQSDVVARAGKFKIDVHVRDVRRRDVATVEEGKAEHDAEHGKDTEVDLPSVASQ